jgi:trans-2,3-dihydro-3-hydroxyanthranilate isomerase
MAKLTFYILDVFTEEKYCGNQLAVIRNAGKLTDKQMQQIAREMNYSETTFILSDAERKGGYDVRIFTPKAEVPFAGHPTLGTAFIIRHRIIRKAVADVSLNLKVGQIPVTFEKVSHGQDILWMKQIEPAFGENIEAGVIAKVLGLERKDVEERFPIEEVSTGLPHIIVPLKSLDAVGRSTIAKDKYFELVDGRWAKAILVFCSQTGCKENDLRVRVFGDYYGVPEDPATGSGNGCLAGYLVKHRYFGKERIDIRVEQGYEIGRPSLLYLKAQDKGGKIDISVGGKVVMVAEGKLI